MNTFDLVLMYYDKPDILRTWFHRLIHHSDFLKFVSRGGIIICDTGSPQDKIETSLNVVRSFPDILPYTTYIRCSTDELRKSVPEGISPRPMAHGYNVACLDVSVADVIITSNIGMVFSPKYFSGHIVEHIKDEKAVVLPKRYDLFWDGYYTADGYKLPWEEILQHKDAKVSPSGGWPDTSIRRRWIQEVGGWDEWYITIAPIDMDMGSRLTGKLDNGSPSEALYPDKGAFKNLGLNFVQPARQDFVSLTCNTYPGHIAKEDPSRQRGYNMGIEYYLKHWGEVKRNENRLPLGFTYELLPMML